jgi:hypothetical protein
MKQIIAVVHVQLMNELGLVGPRVASPVAREIILGITKTKGRTQLLSTLETMRGSE